jgi:hypothetical protein
MLRRFVAVSLAVALGCAASSAQASEPPAAQEWNMVAFDMKSWGRPINSWIILGSGSGSWTEVIAEPGAPPASYTLAVHEVEVGDQGYGDLAAILRRLPSPAPDYEDCESRMTDMPYGTLRLTRGSTTVEIAWNAGCMDQEYSAFLDTLKAANELVGKWGKAGQVIRTEDPPASE